MTTLDLDFRAAGAAPQAAAASRPAGRRWLWNPVVDFLCLGGASLLFLPVLFLLPADRFSAPLAALMMGAAHLVNHPHFAHSYQIFYRDFGRKLAGDGYGPVLRARYVFAGIVAPALIVAFFGVGFSLRDPQLLRWGVNALAFLVGWHYVKQGYGMLMVDSALKKLFFKDGEKKVLLWNAYAVWIASWAVVNEQLSTTDLWGLKSYTIPVPAPFMWAAVAAAVVTGAAAAGAVVRRGRANRALPVNGLVAYAVSLYGWLLFVRINPLWLLVTPFFHSLQYLAVVWRYQTNVEKAREGAPVAPKLLERWGVKKHHVGMGGFVAKGAVLGFAGFWVLPAVLTTWVPYDEALFGPGVFMAVCWLFINVHHYMLDNVMWRRENPDTKKHLFA